MTYKLWGRRMNISMHQARLNAHMAVPASNVWDPMRFCAAHYASYRRIAPWCQLAGGCGLLLLGAAGRSSRRRGKPTAPGQGRARRMAIAAARVCMRGCLLLGEELLGEELALPCVDMSLSRAAPLAVRIEEQDLQRGACEYAQGLSAPGGRRTTCRVGTHPFMPPHGEPLGGYRLPVTDALHKAISNYDMFMLPY